MKERDARVRNLRTLTEKAGGPSALARSNPGVDPTYVSQLLNGHRAFGERSARSMELKLGLVSGSLDEDHGRMAKNPPVSDDLTARYERADEATQVLIRLALQLADQELPCGLSPSIKVMLEAVRMAIRESIKRTEK